jgi:FAD-linked sulfhydryl oxidase
MGYSPLLWGRQAWHFIHFVALSYPDTPNDLDKRNYLRFFKSLHKTLPCPTCAEHFKENMKKIPIRLENRKSLFEWTVDIHNEVNKENKKRILSYEQAIEEINKNALPNDDKSIKKAILLSASVSALIMLFAYHLKKR